MTREEAIKILKELAGYEKTMDLIQNYSVSVQDALYMAIKELEQKPCKDCQYKEWLEGEDLPSVTPQPNDDAISRQAVLDCFKRWQPYMATRLWEFEQELSALPPVTPQPKMGKCKWVKYDHRTICPKEHDADNPYWRTPENRKEVLKYCPYCGLEIVIDEI